MILKIQIYGMKAGTGNGSAIELLTVFLTLHIEQGGMDVAM